MSVVGCEESGLTLVCAVRCSALQCVAVRCSALQRAAECGRVLQSVAECCSVLQHVAVCCSVLQCALGCFIVSIPCVVRVVAWEEAPLRPLFDIFACVSVRSSCVCACVGVCVCECVCVLLVHM